MLLASMLGWGALAAVCARYALAIPRTLVDRGAAWAELGEGYWTLPGAYALAVAAALCFAKPPRRSRSALTTLGLWLLCTLRVALAIGVRAYRLPGYRLSLAQGLAPSTGVACLSWGLLAARASAAR